MVTPPQGGAAASQAAASPAGLPPPRWRRPPLRQRLLWHAAVAAAAIAMVVAAGLVPRWLETELAQRLHEAASRHDLELSFTRLALAPWSGLTVDDLVVALPGADDAGSFRVRQLRLRWRWVGLRDPRLKLEQVEADLLHARAGRLADGSLPLVDRLARLRAQPDRPAGPAKEAAGWRRWVVAELPRFLLGEGRLAWTDDSAGSPLWLAPGVDARRLQVRLMAAHVDELRRTKERWDVAAGAQLQVGGLAGTFRVEVGRDPADGVLRLQVAGDRPLTMAAGGARVALQAIELDESRRVTARHVSVTSERAGGAPVLEMGALRVQLRQPVEQPPGASEWQRWEAIPGPLRPYAAWIDSLALEDVTIAGAAEDVGVPGSPATQDDADDEEAGAVAPELLAGTHGAGAAAALGRDAQAVAPRPSAGRPGTGGPAPAGVAVREALVARSKAMEALVEGTAARLQRWAAALPVRQVRVVRGRARARMGSTRAGPLLNSSFGASIERADDGSVAAELSFRQEDAPSSLRNDVKLRIVPSTGDIGMELQLQSLSLEPWASWLPASVRTHSDTRVVETSGKIHWDGKGRVATVTGQGRVQHVDFVLPRIALHTIADLDLRAKGTLRLDLAQQQLAVTEAEAAVGAWVVTVDAKATALHQAPALEFHAVVPTVGCQDAIDSLVGPIAPMLSGAQCTGTLAFRFDLALDTARLSALKLEIEPTLRDIKVLSLGKHISFDVLRAPFKQRARQRDGRLHEFVTGPGSDRWVDLTEISPLLVDVVTTTEDGAFFWHKGFSLQAIRDAAVANLERGRFVRGASTISQQVVKNLFFVEREKTIGRKLQEAVVTWVLESQFSKQEILALYFNIIEFGPLIYGIKAASNHYFSRAPLELTLLQSIWLGSIIPGPRRFYHQFQAGQVSEGWRKTVCWIADVMLKREKITAEDRQRLGACEVRFGPGPDGSERPDTPSLGYEVDGLDADSAPLAPPRDDPP